MSDTDPLAAPESFRCPFCGGPHFLAMGHASETIRLYESIEASLQDLGLGTDERVERARLRLARSISPQGEDTDD